MLNTSFLGTPGTKHEMVNCSFGWSRSVGFAWGASWIEMIDHWFTVGACRVLEHRGIGERNQTGLVAEDEGYLVKVDRSSTGCKCNTEVDQQIESVIWPVAPGATPYTFPVISRVELA